MSITIIPVQNVTKEDKIRDWSKKTLGFIVADTVIGGIAQNAIAGSGLGAAFGLMSFPAKIAIASLMVKSIDFVTKRLGLRPMTAPERKLMHIATNLIAALFTILILSQILHLSFGTAFELALPMVVFDLIIGGFQYNQARQESSKVLAGSLNSDQELADYYSDFDLDDELFAVPIGYGSRESIKQPENLLDDEEFGLSLSPSEELGAIPIYSTHFA